MSASPSPQQDAPAKNGASARAQRSTLWLTNLAKTTGIVLAVLEWARPGEAQDSVLALCALFVFGMQTVEVVALRIIDRLFARDS